jgi:hypothetical protein
MNNRQFNRHFNEGRVYIYLFIILFIYVLLMIIVK